MSQQILFSNWMFWGIWTGTVVHWVVHISYILLKYIRKFKKFSAFEKYRNFNWESRSVHWRRTVAQASLYRKSVHTHCWARDNGQTTKSSHFYSYESRGGNNKAPFSKLFSIISHWVQANQFKPSWTSNSKL